MKQRCKHFLRGGDALEDETWAVKCEELNVDDGLSEKFTCSGCDATWECATCVDACGRATRGIDEI
jgi:hypothetical protein